MRFIRGDFWGCGEVVERGVVDGLMVWKRGRGDVGGEFDGIPPSAPHGAATSLFKGGFRANDVRPYG